MSISVSARVWKHTRQRGPALLMLLAIADHADDAGRAFPSVGALARKCRVGERAAHQAIATLRDSGELTVLLGQGPRGTNLYVVRQPPEGVQEAAPLQEPALTGAGSCTDPLQEPAPESSVNHQRTTRKRAAPRVGHRPKANSRQQQPQELTFTEWRQANPVAEAPIPDGDPIFRYANEIGLGPEMLQVQWHHFFQTYTEDRPKKTYTDWRAAFRKSVRGNWFRLWSMDAAGAKWTSNGLQSQASYRALMAERNQQQPSTQDELQEA